MKKNKMVMVPLTRAELKDYCDQFAEILADETSPEARSGVYEEIIANWRACSPHYVEQNKAQDKRDGRRFDAAFYRAVQKSNDADAATLERLLPLLA